MRKIAMLAVAAVALSLPVASKAQVSLSLRAGFAPAMGDAANGLKMSDTWKSQIPVQLDAIYSINKNVGIGGYFSYGFGQVGKGFAGECDVPGVSCSGSVLRLGVEGIYSFNAVNQLLPWLGAGIGYEFGNYTAEGGGAKMDVTFDGFEFLNLQGGADYQISSNFSAGPYLMLSFGQYSNGKVTNNVDPSFNGSGSINDKSMHEWLSFGIRGKFDI
jgi:opacity protein-like surface antigen